MDNNVEYASVPSEKIDKMDDIDTIQNIYEDLSKINKKCKKCDDDSCDNVSIIKDQQDDEIEPYENVQLSTTVSYNKTQIVWNYWNKYKFWIIVFIIIAIVLIFALLFGLLFNKKKSNGIIIGPNEKNASLSSLNTPFDRNLNYVKIEKLP
jgi:hypothetical protein